MRANIPWYVSNQMEVRLEVWGTGSVLLGDGGSYFTEKIYLPFVQGVHIFVMLLGFHLLLKSCVALMAKIPLFICRNW